MLFPQENGSRVLMSLNGFWKFAADGSNDGEQRGWSGGIPADREIAVPASWNEQFQDLMHFCETGWYERDVMLPEIYRGMVLKLRIGAANYLTRVWINNNFLGEHEGGHLPMEFDATGALHFDQTNRIVIAVDNRIRPDRLPPGGVENEQIVGYKGQFPNNYYDFFPYGGINRPVYLYGVPQRHITDIAVDTGFQAGSGWIDYRLHFHSPVNGKLRIFLDSREIDAIDLKNQGEVRGRIDVPGVRLWRPEDPYLYQLKYLFCEAGGVTDQYTLPVGVRTIRVDGVRLLLNDQPIFLKGFGMHEDYPVLGKGMQEAFIVKDFNLLRWMGANSLRTSHYPYSEEFLQYADQTGMLVIGETPFVGFVRSHYRETAILKKVERVITEMVERDRNHPAVIIWSLANEGDDFVPEAAPFYKRMYDHAHSLDPGRPITITNCKTVHGDVALPYYDIISINRYYGWYEQAGRLDEGDRRIGEELEECYRLFGKPVIVTEFGADAIAGVHFDPPQQFSEEYQAEMVTRQYRIMKAKPYVVGAHVWAFADFKTSQAPTRTVMNRKGVFTRERQPKLAAHQIRRMWTDESLP